MLKNPEAERAFIGSYLMDANKGRYECAQHGIDSEGAFTDKVASYAYGLIKRLETQGNHVDLVQAIGIASEAAKPHLSPLVDAVGSIKYIAGYADTVAKCQVARRASESAQKLLQDLEATQDPLASIRASCETLGGLSVERDVPVFQVGDFAERKDAQWKAASEGKSLGIPFCIPEVDMALGGLRFGIVSVLAAYRGTGKSTLTRQQAKMTAGLDFPTLLITLEDPAEAADACIAGNDAGVSVFHLDTGQSGRDHRELMQQSWKAMSGMPLFFCEQNVGLTKLSAIVERMVRDHGIKFIILDHIQYLQPHVMKGMSRVDTLAHYSNVLCGWARKHDLHVMVVSQVSNDADKNNRKRLRMSDIRGCGAIADDCRQMIGLYEDEDGSGHVIEVMKNNMGVSQRAVKVTRMDGYQKFAPRMEG